MASVEEATATFDRNIELKTGRSVQDWAGMAHAQRLSKHGAIMDWLKAEHGLSHGYANRVAKFALEAAAPKSVEDPVGHLFEGDKVALRPLYDALASVALKLGSDVELAPKKLNVSVRRRKQFALIQPTTRTRIDLGLNLPNQLPAGRLEASGSFNTMFTHRVKVSSIKDIGEELVGWMSGAYNAAG